MFHRAIGLAATFDVGLLHQVGDVTATEFRAAGGRLYHRVCRATTRTGPKAIAAVKHLALHSGPEPDRHSETSNRCRTT